ncbi:hypothetical protein G5C51_24500 [Streptomyces sp. A7024]|uniref:Helix-turn-helix domain-containing protein n=1 Tax=Streptomyces coryli TaxID=1128680 RepID=A0A6G4U491_9ACTN|nr:hypothetical protein [Streptomyces coryli]NGN67055.1 hypothetical protein [Streptomyces coryli]
MADPNSSAPKRASAEFPSSGVHHVRVPLTENFTVLANNLLQRTGSAVTVGVAAYILSVPEGTPITIAALCKHFSEGEIRIARALRELEDEGWLERRLERTASGRVSTRTFAYSTPDSGLTLELTAQPQGGTRPAGAPAADAPEPPTTVAAAEATEVRPAAEDSPPITAPRAPAPDPRAFDFLGRLHHHDHRLRFSEAETTILARGVTEWLARDVSLNEIETALTGDLPRHLTHRPARIIAHRLATLLPPPETHGPPRPGPLPWQDCGGCDRPFRAKEPGSCRDCREQAFPQLSAAA